MDALAERGLGVVAISYDSVTILQAFEERKGPFRYTLLADVDSKVIEAFGLLNPNTRPGRRTHGMAIPGTYLVDEKGVVVEKFFNVSYRQRLTVDSVLMSVYGGGEKGPQRVEADVESQFGLTAFPSEEEVQPGNQFVLVAELDLDQGMHLYAPGSDYQAVDLFIDDNPMLQAGSLRLPEPETLFLEAIDEAVPVYHGKVRISRTVTLYPRFEGEVVEVNATLMYQTCGDEICYPPSSLPLSFRLKVSSHDFQRAPEDVQHR